ADELSVKADVQGTIDAFALSISGSGVFAGAGSLSLNWTKRTVDAYVSNNANIHTTGNASVQATDESTINSGAGQISGSGTVAIAAAGAYNEIRNTVRARVMTGADVVVTAGNSGNVVIEAVSDAAVHSAAAGISGSGVVSVAGSADANLIDSTIEASITGA